MSFIRKALTSCVITATGICHSAFAGSNFYVSGYRFWSDPTHIIGYGSNNFGEPNKVTSISLGQKGNPNNPESHITLNGVASTSAWSIGKRVDPKFSHFMPRPNGATTQWISFTFKSTNYFTGSNPGHIPIFARLSDGNIDANGMLQWRQNYSINGDSPSNVEGLGLLLGNTVTNENIGCGNLLQHPKFETRIGGIYPNTAATTSDAVATKCADSSLILQDGVSYNIQMHVNDNWIAYWIQDSNGTPISQGSTQYLDYAYLPTPNPSMLANMMSQNTGWVIAPIPSGNFNWQIDITNLGMGWF